MKIDPDAPTEELTDAEQKILQGLGDHLIPLYYVVKLNYYVSALGQVDTTVRDYVKPAIRPLLQSMWNRASAQDKYWAIQAYYAFLEKTAELTGLELNEPDPEPE